MTSSDYDPMRDPTGPLGTRLRQSFESAYRREGLLDQEKELILLASEELKEYGFSAARLLVRMLDAEEQLRRVLKIEKSDNRSPSVESLLPFIGGRYHLLCRWPGSDFLLSPSVLHILEWLRQQNSPWLGSRGSIRRGEPEHPEKALYDEGAPNALWNLRLLAAANRASKDRLAKKEDLDRLADALRFNIGRPGRRRITTDDFLVEQNLYVAYLAFDEILRRAQREIPRSAHTEDSIKTALTKLKFPAFFVERLAQEIAEHRRRRTPASVKLKLQDRAALLVAELEGKRGDYGLPEPASPAEAMDEDVSAPVIVARRKPDPGPFRTSAAEQKYRNALRKTVRWARGRVRQLEDTWNSGFVPPKSDPK